MNKLTEATIGLLERRLLKTARVLAVRVWDPSTFVEVDLHMPGCDMSGWRVAQHMKCRVAPMVYRDYTPCGWDVETQTCTLYVDAAHDGPGSRWARGLVAGDKIEYLGVGSSHQYPERDKRLVFLGDETAIGHFLALQQLAGVGSGNDIRGAIAITDKRHREEFDRYFSLMGLCAVEKDEEGGGRSLEEWVNGQAGSWGEETVFYLVGHSPSVVRLRKMLRQRGLGSRQVKAQGFWD